MPNRKHILVYGDSLTWGIIPATRNRHALNDRWPQVVEAGLSQKVRITTEAIPGRTTVWDDPFRTGRNGRADFLMLLQSHATVDLVVIMLGINDLQTVYPAGAGEAAHGVEMIARDALGHIGDAQDTPPKVLIVAPPVLVESDNPFPVMIGAEPESAKLAGELEQVARLLGCDFFDTSATIKASRDDGVHLDRENTIALGKALIDPVRTALDLQP